MVQYLFVEHLSHIMLYSSTYFTLHSTVYTYNLNPMVKNIVVIANYTNKQCYNVIYLYTYINGRFILLFINIVHEFMIYEYIYYIYCV